MAAQTDIVSGKGIEPVIGGIRPFVFDGKIIPLIGGGIVEGKMAGGTAGAMAGGVFPIGFPTDMTLGTEFSIQFPGKVVQPGDAFKLQGESLF
jgi:hypothetical protein